MWSFLIYFAWLICIALMTKACWDDLYLFGKVVWTVKILLLIGSFLFLSPWGFISTILVWTLFQLFWFLQLHKDVMRPKGDERILITLLYIAPFILFHCVFFIFFWFLR